MRIGVVIAVIVGLALATAVAAWVGFGSVFGALQKVGWRGLVVLIGYAALPYMLLGSAWFSLAGEPVRRWQVFVWSRMVRDAATELLPFSQLGGFVIGARAAVERGIASPAASATTVVDVTTELIAQIGFIGVGIGLLAMRLGAHSIHNALLGAAAIGLVLSGAGAAAFITLQRRGGAMLESLARRFLPQAAAGASDVIAAIEAVYHHRVRIAVAVAFHLSAWVASATGVWLALRFSGVRVDLTAILAIESLVSAVRSAAFVAPMGIGVQEASYAVLGPVFGLPTEFAVAVSLVKRAKDLIIGAPVLLAWQGLEGVRVIRGRAG